MAVAYSEPNGCYEPIVSQELSSWLATVGRVNDKWCSVTRNTEGFLTRVGPQVELPEHLKEQVDQYLLDMAEAYKKNCLRCNKPFWEAVGVPYSLNPALAAAAELGNGAGIELIKQQEGQLGLEEKVSVLSSLYEQALSNWEKELKRANKLQRIVDSYRVRPPAEVPWIYDGNVYQSIPDPNPCIPGKFLDWSKEP